MLGGIDVVEAAGEDRDGAGGNRGFVGGAVDAAGEAGGDNIARLAEAAGDDRREFPAGDGRIPRADDGDHGPAQRRHGADTARSGGASARWRSATRIVGLAHRHHLAAEPVEGREFARRIGLRNRCGSSGRRDGRVRARRQAPRCRCRND